MGYSTAPKCKTAWKLPRPTVQWAHSLTVQLINCYKLSLYMRLFFRYLGNPPALPSGPLAPSAAPLVPMEYHNWPSGFICRAYSQAPSYKENMANQIFCFYSSHGTYAWYWATKVPSVGKLNHWLEILTYRRQLYMNQIKLLNQSKKYNFNHFCTFTILTFTA